jgi:hypothetical protein
VTHEPGDTKPLDWPGSSARGHGGEVCVREGSVCPRQAAGIALETTRTRRSGVGGQVSAVSGKFGHATEESPKVCRKARLDQLLGASA